MPGKSDGIEAAGRIKRELGIPVIFLTAYGDEGLIERAKNVNPLGYLIKPFDFKKLRQKFAPLSPFSPAPEAKKAVKTKENS